LDCGTFIQLIPHQVKFFGDQSNSSERLVHKSLSVLLFFCRNKLIRPFQHQSESPQEMHSVVASSRRFQQQDLLFEVSTQTRKFFKRVRCWRRHCENA
jgi:hypothetical protein